jgi:hypothetical protein
MPKYELDSGDRALLVLLMTIGTDVANVDLAEVHGADVKKERRDKVEKLRLITVVKIDNRISVGLTDNGRDAVLEMITNPPAPGGGLQVAATNALLAQAGRHLAHNGGKPADFFQASGDVAIQPHVDLDLDAIKERVQEAYRQLARRPGDWVKLGALRGRLGGIPRDRVDQALTELNRTASVTVAPDANQKSLTAADREAAVVIGNQPKHAIAIGHR